MNRNNRHTDNIGIFGKKEIRHIRKAAFSKKYELDADLAAFVDKNNREEYDFFSSPLIQTIYRYQIDYMLTFSNIWFKNRSVKILDWGCGRGHVSYWLKKFSKDVVSCDMIDNPVDEYMIKNDFGIDIILLKHNHKLPFEDSCFDIVLSFGVLEHVQNDELSLKELNRILKPDGLFFCFYLPYKLSYTQCFLGKGIHDRLYWKRTIKKLAKKANFEIMDIWHRALFPKRRFKLPFYQVIERIDNWLCNYSLLKYFATNIEFVAKKEIW